ncbi:Bro-N domain-containing protein [Pseudomonas fluorescens]|uniref:BRO-N domain-containing protein n=1 Tax=Pseudomonas fluorescens TaxID=294 RepID=UPI000641B4DC|nr:BRO family protein [Pseudomonas fluorescens]
MSNNSTAVSNVIPFNFGKQQVRTLLVDDQPWFVAADVCASLAIGNVSLAVNGRADRETDGLDEDEKGIATVNTPSGAQEMLVVSESGLYALIFKSRKVEAKRFKKWVTSQVLPAIRKHGHYVDHHGAMGDLVGAVIGTSGEHVLDRVIDQKAYPVPHALQRSFKHTMKSRLRSRFNVQRTALIPAECLADACNFVAAYALEGEWLQAAPKDGITLDKYEAIHLYGLMSYFSAMSEHREHMFSAARLLDSKTLMLFFDMLNEGRGAFASLDKRRDELYQNYRSLGLTGGYAMGMHSAA